MISNIHPETNIPSGWVETTVGEIFEFCYGKGLTQKARNESGNFPVFGSNGVVGKHDRYLVREPSVIIGRKGAAGVVHISYESFWPIDTTYYVKAIEGIGLKYTYYLLKSLRLGQLETSTAIPGLNRDDAYRLRISIAPTGEQNRIISKVEELLSELDNGAEALNKAREQLKVYRQAILKQAFEGKLTAKWREENADKVESPDELIERVKQEREEQYNQRLLDWERSTKEWKINGAEGRKPTKPQKIKELPVVSDYEVSILPKLPEGWKYFRLAQVADVGSGMSVSKNRKLREPVEVPYLRVANVQRGELQLDEVKTMPIEKQTLRELELKKWDVLFNEGGDRDKLGRGWVWENQIEKCITQNHVFRASPILACEYHSKFISHWGNTFGRDYFEKGGKQTTNLASINKTVLSLFPVPMPSMQEQQEIISILEDKMSVIEFLENEVKKALLKSDVMRQSILKKAFSGELVSQDPNDVPASALLEAIRQDKQSNNQG